MNKLNLDRALASLGDALKADDPAFELLNDPAKFVQQIPKRTFSGDHIHGGKITKFSSSGITDSAKNEQLVITDDGVKVTTLLDTAVKGNLVVSEEITAKIIKVDIVEAKELRTQVESKNSDSINFADKISGKGLLWTGTGPAKQFIFRANPDKFFVSDTIDLAGNKAYSIDGVDVLSANALGGTVTKSNLREVGRLRGLIVDGSLSVSDYLYFSADSNRLGLGTFDAKAALNICEDEIDVVIGTKQSNQGYIGTFASHDFNIVTDDTARIIVSAGGNIQLGNRNTAPVQVTVHGKLAVGVNTPDNRATLHVNGALKFNNSLHLSGVEPPTSGAYNLGDIVWNSEPAQRKSVGWVCVVAGTPGVWAQFGEIR